MTPNEKVDDSFTHLIQDVRELRREMNARFDAMNRNLFVGAVAIIAVVIGSNAF